MGALVAALSALLLAGACAPAPEVRMHAAGAYPERLSGWGVIERRGDRLALGNGVEPYEVVTPLFSDYALKLRTLYLPPGTAMGYRREDSFGLPVGSVITKTFFYPLQEPPDDDVLRAAPTWHGDVDRLDLDRYRLVETRLLVRQEHGWDALPYVWQGDDAHLRITGTVETLQIDLAGERRAFPYVVPSRNECAGCHATDHGAGALDLIGIKARQLDRPYPGASQSQLTGWAERDRLAGLPEAAARPPVVAWDDDAAPVEARARAYLDANCGHCHSATGPADTSGLLLDVSASSYRALGVCKPPIAAGRGTGGHAYSIVPGQPDASILVYRMETGDPATRMPELGRALVHREGVALIREWVRRLPGQCL